MQQPNDYGDSNPKAISKTSKHLSTLHFMEHKHEKSETKAIEIMDKNSIAPENVRHETLSWVDREFNPEFNNYTPLKEGEEGLDEIKVMQNQAHPGDEKIIEINNMNNTMDNKKKNRLKYISSPPKLNRITFNFDLSQRQDSTSSNESQPTSPVKYDFEEGIPEVDEVKSPTSNQQYNSYGTFADSNQSPQLKFESLNTNKMDMNNQNLFKDNNPHIVNVNDHGFSGKENKGMYSYQNGETFSPITPSISTNINSATESTPLFIPFPNGNRFENFTFYMKSWTIQFFKYLPAVLLGVLLNLLDSLSYGIIIFPKHETMPHTYVQSGISMFLVSTVVAQLVYCTGISNFKGGNGSMMIEVMPFLHIICQIIIEKIGVEHPKEIIATVMVAYSISTILTGVVFYLLGTFKLGNIMSFFPRHILIGCIGGIGLFLVQTGIEIITGYSFDLTFDYVKNIFTTPTLPIWLLSMALALCLSIAHTKISHPLLTPSFFLILPVVFYIIVFIGGFDLNRLREQGWLFNLISDDSSKESVPFYTFWTYFDFKKTQWSVLPYTFGTIFALVFFGILHVPINVPALSVSVNTDVDINKELRIHGYTNLLSGFIGSLQNYLVYSNSVLFIRSGGGSNVAGFMLAVATFALLVVGTSFIKFVPTIIVGGLIFHLGFDLMKEALIDTFGTVSLIEYITIVLIVICMDIWGFTEGIVVGIIVACIFFIITLSRRKIIRSVHSGSELPRVGFLSNIDGDEGNEYFKYFHNYDSAIEWCENMLLETQYEASKREYLLRTTEDGVTKIILNREKPNQNMLMLSPNTSTISYSPSTISFTDYKSVTKININDYDQPMRLLIQTLLNDNTEVEMRVFRELTKYFKCIEIKNSMVLWQKSSSVVENQIYIVESGQALLYSVYKNSSHIVKEKLLYS
ncbi:hypothetical protein PIROE2DRAFT_63055 [Piromyces sp. E2]|nr:hypothetical protein PIROE2DRAFT_63055 [Piromyces sp. E2]|eukprot:OUM60580.1 hypothetical protein PIROE2DRAFT_63055 [Piromyces sp. E2]